MMLRALRFLLLALTPLTASAVDGATPAQASLSALLSHIGRQVEQFWEHMGSVSCLESVSQIKLNPGGKVISQKRESYQYVLFMQLAGDELAVEETRELQGKPAKEQAQPLLVTGGFSILALIFHPHFQSSFVFRELDTATAGERRIEFVAVPGARTPSAIELRGRDYPIEWRGTAFVDPASGTVHKIEAGLSSPMDDVGLRELKATVVYEPVPFKNPPSTLWLPKSAGIEARTLKQHWRNFHEFSAYKRFSVSTDVQVGEVK